MHKKSWIVVVMLAAAGLTAPLDCVQAADKPKEKSEPQQTLTPKVAKAVRAAQEEMQKQDWDKALAKLQEAQAVTDRKPYDDFQIADLLGYTQYKRQKYPEALAAFEQSIASGFLPPADQANRIKIAMQLAMDTKDYAKAMQIASQALASNPDAEVYGSLGMAQYLSGDFKSAAATIKQAIETANKTGKPVEENWLRLQMSAYAQMKDRAGLLTSMQQLAAGFPKKQYLQDAFSEWKYAAGNNRPSLDLYRLMLELNLLEDGSDYSQMARLARDAGALGDVIKALERGLANKAFSQGAETDSAAQQLATAKAEVAPDRKELAALEQTVEKNSGEIDVQLGLALVSYGDYAKGVEALQRSLTKGGVKNPDAAQLRLGQAFIKLNRPEDAKKAFDAVNTANSTGLMARLWKGYAIEPEKVPN